MNRKHFATGLLLLLLVMTSCHFYKEYDKESFPTYSWNDGQEVVFTPKIEDIAKTYQIKLGLRHHYGFQSKSLGLHIKMVSPSGKESSQDFELKIKDERNKQIGSCAGDICDLESVVVEERKFDEPGEYRIVINHNERGYRIAGIMEVGLIIDEND
jgi:gliding motility-associated lipoprotein GldH